MGCDRWILILGCRCNYDTVNGSVKQLGFELQSLLLKGTVNLTIFSN